ncbi:AaceriADR282Cp [[Ashbya] aceris (nom. inval.)]|nr:AaceriADR282Cp [[Ashbya] aceris (nom. inval.)]
MFRRLVTPRSLRLRSAPVLRRPYASKAPRSDEMPSAWKMAAVAVISTFIFVQTARSIDRSKPQTEFSEEEFRKVRSGLKRRVTLFEPNELEVLAVLANVPTDKIRAPAGAHVVRVLQALERFRTDKEDKYHALLEELHAQHGDEYPAHLPKGAAVALLGRYIKEVCKAGDSVVLLGFPQNMQEAIQFESEVAVISTLVAPQGSEESQLVKYFNTVNKVITV